MSLVLSTCFLTGTHTKICVFLYPLPESSYPIDARRVGTLHRGKVKNLSRGWLEFSQLFFFCCSADYPISGHVEISDPALCGVIKLPGGYDAPTKMFFERFELEVKVAIHSDLPEHDDYVYTNSVENPASPYDFREVNGTQCGPYPKDSRIKFGPVEYIERFDGSAPLIRYPFTVRIPSRIFTELGPAVFRCIEFETRAWFGSDLFPQRSWGPQMLAVRFANETYRAYIAPYARSHVVDRSGQHRSSIEPQKFRGIPLMYPLPTLP